MCRIFLEVCDSGDDLVTNKCRDNFSCPESRYYKSGPAATFNYMVEKMLREADISIDHWGTIGILHGGQWWSEMF